MLFKFALWSSSLIFFNSGIFCTYYGILYLIQCNYWFIVLIVSVNKMMELGVLDCLCWTCFFKFCEWKYLCWLILLYPQKQKYPRKCLCENLHPRIVLWNLWTRTEKKRNPKIGQSVTLWLIDWGERRNWIIIPSRPKISLTWTRQGEFQKL